jgi:hypothetical protein
MKKMTYKATSTPDSSGIWKNMTSTQAIIRVVLNGIFFWQVTRGLEYLI